VAAQILRHDGVQQLKSGRMTVRDVVREIAKSPEHTQRFFNTESGESTPYERAVGTMYRHLLGRQPDAAGQRGHAQVARRDGAGAVVDRIVDSREYGEQFGEWGVPGSGGLRFCAPNSAVRSEAAPQPRPTTAMRFRGMDRNNDGVISRDEWRGSDRSFRIHDWDGDGELSGNEVDPAIARSGRTIEDEEFDRDDNFDFLDSNGNGRIEPREWHGTVTAFNRLDVNNDNVLSRAEVSSGGGRVAATSGDIVYVDPSVRWTDTGIDVARGDLIGFDVSGSVQLSSNADDVAGPGGARSGRRAVDAPLAAQTAGTLIAMIGNSNPILIGNRRSVRAPAGGRLYLGVNDDHLADNSGSFEVIVTVR
jgi:hypothetical protein